MANAGTKHLSARGKKYPEGKRKDDPAEVPAKRYSPLGWIVLLAPACLVLFLLLFGDSIPWLVQQSSYGAENEAEKYNSYGRERMKAGLYREAFGSFISSIRIDPEFSDAYINISHLYHIQGDNTKAIEWLEKAISLDPPQKDLIYNNLGMLYAQKGEMKTALSMFKQALSAGMKSRQIYKNIGNVYMTLADYPQAVEAYRAAIEHQPTMRSLYLEMLKTTIVDYSGEQELESYREAAEELYQRGVSDEELSVYDSQTVYRFVEHVPQTAVDYRNLGRACEMSGDAVEAEKNYRRALEIDPANARAHYYLGSLMMAESRLDEARGHLETAVKLDREYDPARLALEKVNYLIKLEQRRDQTGDSK